MEKWIGWTTDWSKGYHLGSCCRNGVGGGAGQDEFLNQVHGSEEGQDGKDWTPPRD